MALLARGRAANRRALHVLPHDGSVGTWTADDWRQELVQFDELVFCTTVLNRIAPVELGFGPADVVGARTPCLEGKLDVLHRVLRERGFRYDSSSSAPLGGWPRRDHGVWSFPLPEIRLADSYVDVIAMDYNFLANQPRAATREQRQRVEEQTYASLVDAFDQSYRGNRAPSSVGMHFARWNHGTYVRALTCFLGRVCRLREVRCVPHEDVADWLDHQTSRVPGTKSRVPGTATVRAAQSSRGLRASSRAVRAGPRRAGGRGCG